VAARLAIAAMLLVVLACAAGAWFATQPASAPFIVAGARDLQITAAGPATRRITYTLDDTAGGWQTKVVTRLRGLGWRLAGDRYAWGDTESYIPTYTRTFRIWPVEIQEQAQLIGDRRSALIIVERRLRLEWSRQ